MNTGTEYKEIKDDFVEAQVFTHEQKRKMMNSNDMEFSYRHSVISMTDDIVLSATFALRHKADPLQIREKITHILKDRRRKQPSYPRNCGSVFKSKPGMTPPGWYIEQAGRKGFRIGDAMVAHEHANWVVNLGNAAATDVKKIIEHVQSEVFKKFKIMLEREVIYVPQDITGK